MSLTVTFHNINNPQRSLADLQLLLIYCHLTAHSSRATSQAAYMRMIDYLDKYVGGANNKRPFDIIKKIIADGKLDEFVTEGLAIGRVKQRKKFFESIVNESSIDLRKATRDELSSRILGIGPVKASMFVMFRDRNWQGAVVDINVQKWIRSEFNKLGMAEKAEKIPELPANSAGQYRQIEKAFLEIASLRKVSPRELNIEVLKSLDEPTKYDQADEQRIVRGGKSTESHWDSRMSRNDISLQV